MTRSATTAGDAPLTSADLRAYLATRDDFAFEREVFTHAKGFGLSVRHAGLYEDPATAKLRQFDVRAFKAQEYARIALAIECKTMQPSYPLLVSCVPRPTDEAYHELLYTRDVVGPNNSHASAGRPTASSALYTAGEYVGKDMRQVGHDGPGKFAGSDRELFDKYQQAMASCADLVDEAIERHRAAPAPLLLATAVLPVLTVPDGMLWIAKYSSSGRLESDPEPAREITFYLGRKYRLQREMVDFTISHLHIMTKTAVVDLLRQVGGPPRDGIWQLLFG